MVLGSTQLTPLPFSLPPSLPPSPTLSPFPIFRYGHGIFDRRPSKDGKKGGSGRGGGGEGREGGSGGGIGGNVFWKQWYFPVKTRGRNMGEDEDDVMDGGVGGDYFNPLVDGEGGRAEAAAAEREFESSDRRPWTDLIPRFRVKVEPMTTLKLRKRFYPFKTVIELGADYNTQVGREGREGGREGGREEYVLERKKEVRVTSAATLSRSREDSTFSFKTPSSLPPSLPRSLRSACGSSSPRGKIELLAAA